MYESSKRGKLDRSVAESQTQPPHLPVLYYITLYICYLVIWSILDSSVVLFNVYANKMCSNTLVLCREEVPFDFYIIPLCVEKIFKVLIEAPLRHTHQEEEKQGEWTGWKLLTMAGLFDCWTPPEGGEPLYSYSVITVNASSNLQTIHDR